MIEILYVALGMLVGGLAVELVKRQGRQELEEVKRELLTKLESIQASTKRLEQPGVNRVAVNARPQQGDEVERLIRESLAGVQQLLRDVQLLNGRQTTAVHKLEDLQAALSLLASSPLRSNEAPAKPAATSSYEAAPAAPARPAMPPADRAMPAELCARMTSLWNELPWPNHSDEGIRRLSSQLGLRIDGPLKHRYWLLHAGGGGEPLFLLPSLGKDVSFFPDGFFEMPKAGNANQVRSPALVQLRPGELLEDELARLRDPDSGLGLAQVFPEFRRGHVE